MNAVVNAEWCVYVNQCCQYYSRFSRGNKTTLSIYLQSIPFLTEVLTFLNFLRCAVLLCETKTLDVVEAHIPPELLVMSALMTCRAGIKTIITSD